jgi:membrane-bound lytic murein transglycosylase D
MRTPRLAPLLILWLGLASVSPLAADAGSGSNAVFPRPDSLAPAVAFWTRVYTELDTNSGFIHDNRELKVIYQVLRLNPYVGPAVQDKTIERVVERYRRALLALAGGKRRGLTKAERRALQAWGEAVTAPELQSAAERVRFQRGQSNRFKKGLLRSANWSDRIEDILRAQGLPTELAALPHLESSYNPAARSRAGAAGLWQLMPATAQRYLRVDDTVDERLDPYKSTEAAARLLQHNYTVLNSWPLALTAYNHGLSGMWRAVRDAGTTDLGEIIRKYDGERFGFASRNFYAAFLAALDVSRNSTEYFGNNLDASEADPIVVTVPAYLPVEALTEAFEIDREYLRALNPSLPGTVWSDDKFVPKDYGLRLPTFQSLAEAEHTMQALVQIAGYTSQKPDVYHQVQPGESLSVIAEKYDTSVLELVAMNQLQDRHRIRAGDKLLVATGPAPERLITSGPTIATHDALPQKTPLMSDAAEMDADPPNRDDLAESATGVLLLAGMTGGLDAQGAPAGLGSPDPGLKKTADSDDPISPESDRPKPRTQAPAEVSQERIPDDQGDLSHTADEQEAEDNGSPVEAQPELAADPADYSVAADGSIRIQAAETLGHYADWLGVRSGRLQELNNLKDGEPLVVGHRLKLDFSNVAAERFQQQRTAYHQSLQAEYFRHFHIEGVRAHRVKDGDNLWILATRQYDIPLWLLRQYNPSIDFDAVLPPGEVISIPIVQG